MQHPQKLKIKQKVVAFIHVTILDERENSIIILNRGTTMYILYNIFLSYLLKYFVGIEIISVKIKPEPN